jgi:DNA-3-methyladenine glycosylase II
VPTPRRSPADPLAAAVAHLKRADPTLGRVIRRVGACTLAPRREGTHFDAVLRAIVYQQLSGKAAGTILGRVHGIYGGRSPTPDELLATPDETLRAAGLSRQKLGYARDLAARVAAGALPVDALDAMGDDEIIAALSAVKGVGRWTAQMFLMFRLGRLDVLPDLDLGVQKGIQLAYGLDQLPRPKEVLAIGAPWAPYRSVAAWYLWRSLDNGDGQTAAPP